MNTIDARGGTELAQGFLKAVEVLGDGGGDVLILTDGQIAGTEQILAQARATETRLHCLGIGSASQDRFLALLARETGGISRFVTPRERVDLAAVDLFASIARPVASGLKATGNIQPAPASTIFSGTPVLLFGEEDESVDLTWDGGALSLPISYDGAETGETIRLLQGSRLITDWESHYPAREALAPLEKRKESRVAQRLRELSRTYGLASREMSLVAVVKRAGDRPGELPETHVVPVGMAQDIDFRAYFSTSAILSLGASAMRPSSAPRLRFQPSLGPLESLLDYSLGESLGEPSVKEDRVEGLLMLSLSLDPDGGMPGDTPKDRAASSIAALFAFLQHGHTRSAGAFRKHVTRLIAFLESVSGLTPDCQRVIAAALAMVRKDQAPAGDWLTTAEKGHKLWAKIEKELRNTGP